MNEDIDGMIIFPIDDSSAQHQDQLEKEQRLEEILRYLYNHFLFLGINRTKTIVSKEDIDFVAAACGKSDYRK